MIKKVFDKKAWFDYSVKNENVKERIREYVSELFNENGWVAECEGLTEEECKKLNYLVDSSWFVEKRVDNKQMYIDDSNDLVIKALSEEMILRLSELDKVCLQIDEQLETILLELINKNKGDKGAFALTAAALNYYNSHSSIQRKDLISQIYELARNSLKEE